MQAWSKLNIRPTLKLEYLITISISARIAGIQIPMELSFHGKRPDQQPAPTRPESEPTSKTDASKESTTTIAPIDDAKLHSTDTPSTRSTIAIVPADDVEVRSTDASGVATIVDNEREDDSQSGLSYKLILFEMLAYSLQYIKLYRSPEVFSKRAGCSECLGLSQEASV